MIKQSGGFPWSPFEAVGGGVDELVVLKGFLCLLIHWLSISFMSSCGWAALREPVARSRGAELLVYQWQGWEQKAMRAVVMGRLRLFSGEAKRHATCSDRSLGLSP